MGTISKTTKMSSREIAELTGKLHSNVMVDCRKMDELYEKLGELKLQSSSYVSKQNKEQPMFLLTKMQTMDLLTGYNTELRIKVNRRWEQLEQQNQQSLPQTFSEALQLAADQAKKIEQQQSQLKEQEHKVVFADAVAGSSNAILVREFAKVLTDDGFEIGQNRLFAWFRDNNYLMRNNEPYQQYIAQGLFEVIERVIGDSNSLITVKTTKISPKGQVYFTKKIRKQ